MEHKKLWPRAAIKKLIELFKEHEFLYNRRHIDFRNHLKRKQTCKYICSELNALDNNNFTVEELQNKIKAMRRQYLSALKLVRTAKENGNVYRPKLWFYRSLDFLKHYNSAANNNAECDESSTSNESDADTADMKSKLNLWEMETVEKLIALFKEHEILYNANNPHYSNKTKREEVLEDICNELQFFNENITVGDVRFKLKSLRHQYVLTYRLVQKARENGKIYKPKLWYYQLMNFLEKHILIASRQVDNSNVSTTNEQINSQQAEESCSSNMSVNSVEMKCEYLETPLSPMPEKLNIYKSLSKNDEKFTNLMQQQRIEEPAFGSINNENNVERKYEWLGEQAVMIINKMQSEDLQSETAWAIQTLLRRNALKDKAMREKVQPNTSTDA